MNLTKYPFILNNRYQVFTIAAIGNGEVILIRFDAEQVDLN